MTHDYYGRRPGWKILAKSRRNIPSSSFADQQQAMLQITVGGVKNFAPDKIFIITADNYRDRLPADTRCSQGKYHPWTPGGTSRSYWPCGSDYSAKDPQGWWWPSCNHYISDQDRFIEVLQGEAAAEPCGDHRHRNRPERAPAISYRVNSTGSIKASPPCHVKFMKTWSGKSHGIFRKRLLLLEQRYFYLASGPDQRLITEHLPVLAAGLEKIERQLYISFPQTLKRVYEGLPGISIDYGVMEDMGVLMAIGDFGWDDVGSWTAGPTKKRIQTAISWRGRVCWWTPKTPWCRSLTRW